MGARGPACTPAYQRCRSNAIRDSVALCRMMEMPYEQLNRQSVATIDREGQRGGRCHILGQSKGIFHCLSLGLFAVKSLPFNSSA